MTQRYISETDLQKFVDIQMYNFDDILAIADKSPSKEVAETVKDITLAKKALLETMMDYLDEKATHISINEDGESEKE